MQRRTPLPPQPSDAVEQHRGSGVAVRGSSILGNPVGLSRPRRARSPQILNHASLGADQEAGKWHDANQRQRLPPLLFGCVLGRKRKTNTLNKQIKNGSHGSPQRAQVLAAVCCERAGSRFRGATITVRGCEQIWEWRGGWRCGPQGGEHRPAAHQLETRLWHISQLTWLK